MSSFATLKKVVRLIATGLVTTAALAVAPAAETNAAVTLAAPWQYGNTLAAGGQHLCFVGNTSFNCVGENADGQIGDGTTTDVSHGKKIEDSTDTMKFANIAYGTAGENHSCVITAMGTPSGILYCWGDNQYGQLGDGTTSDRSSPTRVADNSASGFVNSGISRVVAGYNHTCAVKSDQLYCWGLNDQGQLGDGTTTNSSLPIKPSGVFASANASSAITLGQSHSCATHYNMSPRTVYCWGDNQYGQLGDGTTTDSLIPVITDISAAPGASEAQHSYSLASTADSNCIAGNSGFGNVYCWGRNDQGQLGDGTTTNRSVPTLVVASGTFANNYTSGAGNGAARYLGAGGTTVCVRTVAGATPNRYLHCWGGNLSSQIAGSVNTAETSPVAIPANSAESFDPADNQDFNNVTVSKSTTNGFACFAKWCWGGSASGQLGRGDTSIQTLPVKYKIGTEQSSGGGSGGGGGGGMAPDVATGVKVTAILKNGKVEVTFSDLPASALNLVTVVVAPTSFDLATPQFGASFTDYTGVTLIGNTLPTVTNNGFTITVDNMTKVTFTNGAPSPRVVENFTTTGSYHIRYSVYGDTMAGYPNGWVAKNATSPSFVPLVVSTEATTTTTTEAPTTTVAATTTTVANVYAAAKAGVTVTDSKVYRTPPKEVAASSAINVLTKAQNKVMDIETKTPAICVPNDDELVFIDEGKCIARVVNAKTRAVLRTLKTTVVGDDISEVKVGNEIVTLAPIYFDVMSTKLDAKAMGRLRSLKARISAAGSVLIIGHSGTLNGNSPANIAVSKARAESTLAALKAVKARGPFAISGVGALDPASNGKTEADQAKNRRVVIVLIP